MEQIVKNENKALKIMGWVLASVFFAICAVIIFFNVTHEYHVVQGDSMLPTLNNNQTDGVFVSKIKSYDRGDIIVINKGEKDEKGNDILVIKRLIATSGDKITIREIDGYNRIVIIYAGEQEETILNEPYLSGYENNIKLKSKFNNMVSNQGIVLSDGFLVVPEGHIFYLGDNRLTSNDSSTYGTKPKENVIGKVDYIAYGNKNIYWQVIKQVFGW